MGLSDKSERNATQRNAIFAAGAKKPTEGLVRMDEKKRERENQTRGKQRVGAAAAAAAARTQKSGRICKKKRNAVVETRSVSVTHRDASDAVLPQPVATVRPVPL